MPEIRTFTDNSYVFALEYGVDSVSRKAYFQLNRLQDKSVQGHIYEFVQYKDKDLVASCADFYIDDTYTSVVGNKASGLIGLKVILINFIKLMKANSLVMKLEKH